jgi:hypothetical protein
VQHYIKQPTAWAHAGSSCTQAVFLYLFTIFIYRRYL